MDEETVWFKAEEHRVLNGKKGVRDAYDRMSASHAHSRYLYWTKRMEEVEEKAVKGEDPDALHYSNIELQ